MDVNTIRGLVTLVLLLAFVGLVLWLMLGTRKSDFDAAARLALDDDLEAVRDSQGRKN